MTLSRELLKSLIDITSKSAIACYPYIGKNEKILADKAATDMMRDQLNKLNIKGEVVIGEGELDEAPMLYIGEKIGSGDGLKLDFAVDPVEGTNFVAKNLNGGMSVMAFAERGNLFNAPETYMNKIAACKDIPDNCIDLDFSIEKNINNLSDFKKKKAKDMIVCILDRPRHKDIINKLKKLQVQIKLIQDGDVSGALLVTDKKYNVDLFLGIGGGPEGVLAACALDAFECFFQGRFLFETKNDINRANAMGINDLSKKYNLNEIIKGDSMFFATGITSGDLVKGVEFKNNIFYTETLVTHKNSSINIVKKEIAST